jgi:hypothetical protein
VLRRKLLLGPSFATALPPDAPYYLHLDSDDEDEDDEYDDVDGEDGGAAEGGEVGTEAKGDGVVTADKLRWLYDEDDDALVDEVGRPRPHQTVHSIISSAWA